MNHIRSVSQQATESHQYVIKLPRIELIPSKILCIGRNYALHAAEMSSAVPTVPIVFLKPASALIDTGGEIILPDQTSDVHHEVELVMRIGTGGKHIAEPEAMRHVDAFAVGLDLTARDIQAEAKKIGHPWTVAKGFDTFAPLGPFRDAADVTDPQSLDISLRINGELRQHGNTRDMIFSLPYLIAYLSRIFTLFPGDLIYTGTPEGVGSIRHNDELHAQITGLPDLRVAVRRAD